MPMILADTWTESANQEELHRWLTDSLQDLEQMRDVLVARRAEVGEPEEDGRLLYALWLNRQALHSVEIMMHLFSFNTSFAHEGFTSERGDEHVSRKHRFFSILSVLDEPMA